MSFETREIWTDAGGSVPAHWNFVRFEDLLADPKSIAVGVMYPGTHDESGIPLIKVSDVKNGAVVGEPDFRISKVVNHEYRRTSLSGNELLITLVGNPGDCAIVDQSMAGWNAARALAVVRLKDPAIRPWLRYVLLSNTAKHLIDARLNTTVQRTLNLKDIRRLPIPIAPKAERDAIVEIAAGLENKINVNQEINQILEQIAQAIFKSWFVDFEPVKAKITARQRWHTLQPVAEPASPVCYADDEVSLPDLETYMNLAAMQAISGKDEEQLAQMQAEEHAELLATAELFPSAMRESELGEIPEGWECLALDEIAKYQNGLALQKFRPENENSYLPVVKIAQLKKGFADGEEKASTNIKPECIIDNGDVVFSWSGSLIVDIWCGGRAALNQHLFKVTSMAYPKWLYFLFTRHHLDEFQRIAADKAVTMGHIKREHLKRAICAIPNRSFNEKVGKVLEEILAKQVELRLESVTLSNLRDTLLPKILSGELEMSKVDM